MNISQQEADTLRVIEKYLTNPKEVNIPFPGKTNINAMHYFRDKRYDDMKLSMFHARKNLNKVSYRIIYNNNVILTRIDTEDATQHVNPDKQIVIAPYQPHIHIYREGYGDKFAYPLPAEFSHADDIFQLLIEFLSYSMVINIDKVVALNYRSDIYD